MVVTSERGCSAMLEVVAHELPPCCTKSLGDRGDLHHHICAVPVVFDHLLDTANLPFYSAQALQVAGLDVRIDCNSFASALRGAPAARPDQITLGGMFYAP